MRGTPFRHRFRFNLSGIIPAYAGNTFLAYSSTFSFRDHPRICGEHSCDMSVLSTSAGSSPHMRGTRVRAHGYVDSAGIIPAYAGNTERHPYKMCVSGDHPRICGEHDLHQRRAAISAGSSPHMRGTHRCRGERRVKAGIIPAYAGNTTYLDTLTRVLKDHPRICGEHSIFALCDVPYQGSSPHMRGTLLNNPTHRRVAGIIPAYAGNTLRKTKRTAWARDHPRICGEHVSNAETNVTRAGSSPHMRGTPKSMILSRRCLGIIPAYAGNTRTHQMPSQRQWDHPRICGEHPS